MLIRSFWLWSLPCVIVLGIFGSIAADGISGQEKANLVDSETPSPNQEKFTEIDSLLTPWVDSDCFDVVHNRVAPPDCNPSTLAERQPHRRVSLFNANGSLWYRFSVYPADSDSFMPPGDSESTKKTGFIPFGLSKSNPDYAPVRLVLRIKAESANWFEVEVNEVTRETKFAPKSEPRLWAKTGWGFWFARGLPLTFDSSKTKLLDKPEGKVIEEAAQLGIDWAVYLKSDGEWIFVERIFSHKVFRGWIRSRKGRDLLVGCVLNDHKIP